MTKKKKNKSALGKWGKSFFYTSLFLFMISIIILMFMGHLSRDLPTLEELKSFNPEQISKILSADGEVIHKLQAVKKREVIKIGDVPQNLINSLIVMEDKDFYCNNFINAAYMVSTRLRYRGHTLINKWNT